MNDLESAIEKAKRMLRSADNDASDWEFSRAELERLIAAGEAIISLMRAVS